MLSICEGRRNGMENVQRFVHLFECSINLLKVFIIHLLREPVLVVEFQNLTKDGHVDGHKLNNGKRHGGEHSLSSR